MDKMTGFWNWMIKKEYADEYPNSKMPYVRDGVNDASIPTKQMLVGYMMEYLMEREEKLYCIENSIDEFYEDLVTQINERQ